MKRGPLVSVVLVGALVTGAAGQVTSAGAAPFRTAFSGRVDAEAASLYTHFTDENGQQQSCGENFLRLYDQSPPGAESYVRSFPLAADRVTGTLDLDSALALDGAVPQVRSSGTAEMSSIEHPCSPSGRAYTEVLFGLDVPDDERWEYTIEGTVSVSGQCARIDIGFGGFSKLAKTCDTDVPGGSFSATGIAGSNGLSGSVKVYVGASVGGSRVDWDLTISFGCRSILTPNGECITFSVEQTTFDWKVPSRYGADANGDGLVDAYPTDASVTPADGFEVDFSTGDAGSCRDRFSRGWRIDGSLVTFSDPQVVLFDPNGCLFKYRFPEEGVYEVTMDLRHEPDGTHLSSLTRQVVVQDWLIFSLGDSVASGEGTPDEPGSPPRWRDRQCHRSASAGPSLAAIRLENQDPKTSVTFVHLACSGATMDQGVLGAYIGQEPGQLLAPQVDQMQTLAAGREIDAVTLSVGANDVEFSTILKNCFAYADCEKHGGVGSGSDHFDARVGLLASRYDAVGAALAARDVARDRVLITEYFDPLHDDTGAVCGEAIFEEAAPVPVLGISDAEATWASDDMMPRLNAEVAAGRARNGWRYVGGISASFKPHGYCAQDRWIVQLTEALPQQGNPDGTIHPNEAGHALGYAPAIVDSIRADLYPAGQARAPRPRTA